MLASSKGPAITVDIARTEAEWGRGLDLVDRVYQQTYGSHWRAKPDVLFVAQDDEGPVATAGLELGKLRRQLDTERYFSLSPSMAEFIEEHRERSAELGRFSCLPRARVVGSQAVFRAAFKYCANEGIDFLFGWARPDLARHYISLQRPVAAADAPHATQLAVPFCTLDVPLDEGNIRSCESWTKPPVNFFFGQGTPRLMLVVIPFLDAVTKGLDASLQGVVDDRSGRVEKLRMDSVQVGAR